MQGSLQQYPKRQESKGMKLEVKNVTYQYTSKDKTILENFSFTMTNKERLGLVAPSGVGKTTLCKLIAGYLTPDQGEILLDGKDRKSVV